jgi:succinate-semialdehyde dehydrogenase/glutarate-semialdehyde dehydrogenase
MILSKNPYNGETLQEHKESTSEDIDKALEKATAAFKEWKTTSFSFRSKLMLKASEELKKNRQEYAEVITREMGKPIKQAIAEVEKCAWVCEYYAENAEKQLAPESIETDAEKSYINYAPLGVVMAIMPWNYPFWQVFRFAAPALMAGNVGVLKHASNVMMCGKNIEKVFIRAGFPEACFQNLTIGSKKVEEVVKDKRVKAVTLTGSEGAGGSVAATAGKEIKKSVLELGGSNALVVFDDADLEETVKTCVQARFQNTGQSCIAGKRLLLHQNIAEEFTEMFLEKVKALKAGDPLDEDTFIGVQAREDLAKDLEKQVDDSVEMGAKILTGGVRKKAFYAPTVLKDVTAKMPVFKEETFGPAIGITTFKSDEEAVDLINATRFGLGVSLFTENHQKAEQLISQIEDGAVFVNELVKSDPRLPFGGTKKSGYGRELSKFGIREFVNIQTVYFK